MLNPQQRSRAAIAIAQMAAMLANDEDTQQNIAYSMQEFALMLLGEGNEELTPSDALFQAVNEPDGKLKVVIVSGDAAATLLIDDEEAERVGVERHLNLAQWLKAAAEIDLECIS